jgi:hypothetical protein
MTQTEWNQYVGSDIEYKLTCEGLIKPEEN